MRDPYHKSRTLSEIARALASTDRNTAENLLGEAVYLANDINDDNKKYEAFSLITRIIVDSRFNTDRILDIIGMISDPKQLYEIALYSRELSNRVWIQIIKQLINYPKMVYLICSLICMRNLEQSKDIVNVMMKNALNL